MVNEPEKENVAVRGSGPTSATSGIRMNALRKLIAYAIKETRITDARLAKDAMAIFATNGSALRPHTARARPKKQNGGHSAGR